MLKPNQLTFLAACDSELYHWTCGMYPDEEPSGGEAYKHNPEQWATYLTWNSLQLIQRGCNDAAGQPRTALAKMTIRAAMREDLIPSIDGFYPGDVLEDEDPVHPLDAAGCFESETRFAHSLRKQHSGEKESSPACILLDVNGEPIAYQKGNGKPTALTWRDGYISTADGSRWTPKNALIRPLYVSGHDPRASDVDAGLLVPEIAHIQTAHFLRFVAASWMTESIAGKVLRQVSDRAGHDIHEADIVLGTKLSAWRLRKSVLPLLDKA